MSTRLLLAKLIASFTRKVRFPGRERFLRFLFPPEYFRRIGSCESIVPYDGDLNFRCDLGSWIEWQIFFKSYYGPDLSMAIKKLVKPGMQVIDVGANVGAYTLLAAKRVGSAGKVVSFEPNPEALQRLEHNIRLNHFEERVAILPFALSDKEGEFTLYVPRAEHPHRGISSLQRYVDVLTEGIKVQVKTLDNIFANLELERLDFLKVDTDGSDASVLEGGMQIIGRFYPYIIFEANYLAHPDAAVAIERVRSKLKSLGYSFFTVGYFGRLKPCPPKMPLPDSDIVCVPAKP